MPRRRPAKDKPARVYSWQDDAECRKADPSLFVIELGSSAEPAREVCRRCPVRSDCLEFALLHRERGGVWGGMTQEERDAEGIRRRRRVSA